MNELRRKTSILPMSRSFGHSLRHVNRLIQRDLGARVARLGITLGQWYVLRALWHTDGLTQVQLAEQSGIAGPAMVFAVRSLLAMGLVSRERPSNDKRKYLIFLTPKGAALEDEALRVALNVNQEALAGALEDEVAICMRVLDIARANLLRGGISAENPAEIDAMIE